jgi:hypothetical protein
LSQVIPVFSRETENAADYAGCRQNVMVSVVTLIIEKTMKKIFKKKLFLTYRPKFFRDMKPEPDRYLFLCLTDCVA